MKFSELINGTCCTFSPDGRYISCVHDDTVDVRYTGTLLVAYNFNCSDTVQSIKWSLDSSLVLCVAGQSTIEVYTVRSGHRVAVIHVPTCSLGQVMWASDSRRIISVEHQLLRIAIWTLDKSAGCPGVTHIDGVQPWAEPGAALSPNGQYLAAVMYLPDGCGTINQNDHKSESERDIVCFYSTITWKKIRCVQCSLIRRVGGIAWSPDNDTLVVWAASPPDPVLFISALSGNVVSHWSPEGTPLWSGVSQLAFSPSSQFAAVVSRNGQVHILNYIGWQEETELLFTSQIKSTKCDVYCVAWRQKNFSDNISCPKFREVVDRPVSISTLCSPPKGKGTLVLWSSGGRFLASVSAHAPAIVWIWSVAENFDLRCVIAMENPVQSILWDPLVNTLAMCCGDDGVAVWYSNRKGVQFACLNVYPISMPYEISHLSWNCSGKSLVASSDLNSSVVDIESTMGE